MKEVCPNGEQHCLAAPRIDQYSDIYVDIRHTDRFILKRSLIGRRLGFKRPGIRECRLKTPRNRANVGSLLLPAAPAEEFAASKAQPNLCGGGNTPKEDASMTRIGLITGLAIAALPSL